MILTLFEQWAMEEVWESIELCSLHYDNSVLVAIVQYTAWDTSNFSQSWERSFMMADLKQYGGGTMRNKEVSEASGGIKHFCMHYTRLLSLIFLRPIAHDNTTVQVSDAEHSTDWCNPATYCFHRQDLSYIVSVLGQGRISVNNKSWSQTKVLVSNLFPSTLPQTAQLRSLYSYTGERPRYI